MDRDMKSLEGVFRLLVPVSCATTPGTSSIALCGDCWVFVEYASATDAPPYTCISYAWGTGRTKHPFYAGQEMSDQTIPAIEATIKAIQPQALWIDALCVPPYDPLRTTCLQSMGAIYSSASQVCGVLSESCSKVFQQISDTGVINPEFLFTLENDDWPIRSWTYQEVVNSQSLFLVTLPGNGISMPGLEFLNAVLWATTEYKRINNIDPFTWAIQHPKLHILEDWIADYLIANHVERSVYQVMSVMHRRVSQRPEDYFYAMVESIKTSPVHALKNYSIDPSEFFMQVCEAKGDFSFIYSIGPRGMVPGSRWRPTIGQLRPILSGILVVGKGLIGRQQPTHLELENVCLLDQGSASTNGLKTTTEFLLPLDKNHSSIKEIADAIFEHLRLLGFSGSSEYIELQNGLFFPQSPVAHPEGLLVAITPDVRWVDGAPGLLLHPSESGIYELCDVGVFIGRVPKIGELIKLG